MVMSKLNTVDVPMGRGERKSRQRGISLVEVMTGLVLVSGLLGIGVPSFREFIVDQRANAASTDIVIALMTARSEAVKRNRTVELKAHPEGWSAGWTVETADAPAILEHVAMAGVTIVGPDSPSSIQFSPSGRTLAATEFTIDPGSDASNVCRLVQLGLDGRTTFAKQGCSDESVQSL